MVIKAYQTCVLTGPPAKELSMLPFLWMACDLGKARGNKSHSRRENKENRRFITRQFCLSHMHTPIHSPNTPEKSILPSLLCLCVQLIKVKDIWFGISLAICQGAHTHTKKSTSLGKDKQYFSNYFTFQL